MERWKNYGLWISLFALLGLLLSDFGKLPSNYAEYVDIILSILVMAGIISNPTSGTGYLDIKEKSKELK